MSRWRDGRNERWREGSVGQTGGKQEIGMEG